MSKWQSKIYSGELAYSIKTEYRNLLALKKSEHEAESITLAHFMQSVYPGSNEEGRLWLALALQQWELGRLSDYVKKNAIAWIRKPIDGFDKETLSILESTLQSQQPVKKRISLPSWVKKCPWPVGSLLAYCITSNQNLSTSQYWNKYVLLRIIQINYTPVSALDPDANGSESMLVGLYNWYGDKIPNPSIVDSLEFTPIVVRGPSLVGKSASIIQNIPLDPHGINKETISKLKLATTENRIETCCCLDWKCAKGINCGEVFKYLECDASFQNAVPVFFETEVTHYSFAHSIPFDAMLCNRLHQLFST